MQLLVLCLGVALEGVRNGRFDGDSVFMFFIFFISVFLVKCAVDVSSVVSAPWRCGVLTTWSGIAGIGLGLSLGESMIQLPRVGWRLLAS